MSPLRWTCTSTHHLADALTAQGHPASARTVAELLGGMGYSLQATSKQVEGAQHPDRDGQFRYLNEQAKAHLAARQPVLSVDTKKKEVVGNLANKGRAWQPSGDPVRVDVHDFPDPTVGKAIPYGVYDLGADTGWVSVGDDHDTAASGLQVTVCHFPPGTSKWNKIEHRLFAHISMNWRGRPLVSHEVIVDLIGATTTRTGLKVQAARDRGRYPTGVKISDAELAAVPLTGHAWHGEWNYTIGGAATRTTAA